MRLSLIIQVLICIMFNEISLAQESKNWGPDFLVAQYAGSIGYASVGVGYDLGKKSRASIHYGYVPENKGGVLNIVTGKYSYSPVTIQPSSKYLIQPINVGGMISYHLGGDYYFRWPKHRYPTGYYWWSSALRIHATIESSITFQINDSFIKSITTYVEFNTNDLYIISYLQNIESLHLFDIVKTGVGVRVKF
ncbi:MAG: hypothetical protein JNL53_19260 [Cyclobacteriaceae bacterium]|nr:hypothetical protein [Cyclobacteriaceae bacterium]